MNIQEAIEFLEGQIQAPSSGLPEDIFLFTSRLTPMVNVDLLVKNENSQTLLAWRDDQFVGAGWHLPGGIIRFKEKLETRLLKVAETELGTSVTFEAEPIAINQIIRDHDTRGHFVSFLYKCFLSSEYVLKNDGLRDTDNGYLKWHNACPKNLIKVHEVYRKWIQESAV
jgi:ADP-ribose pyrophosphatase YjhB (NUDIX family)